MRNLGGYEQGVYHKGHTGSRRRDLHATVVPRLRQAGQALVYSYLHNNFNFLKPFGGDVRLRKRHSLVSLDRLLVWCPARAARLGLPFFARAFSSQIPSECNGGPGQSRTADKQFRKLLLYPSELRGHAKELQSLVYTGRFCIEGPMRGVYTSTAN